jgi:hypothetical protein
MGADLCCHPSVSQRSTSRRTRPASSGALSHMICWRHPSPLPAERTHLSPLCRTQWSARIDDEGLPRPGAGAPLHQRAVHQGGPDNWRSLSFCALGAPCRVGSWVRVLIQSYYKWINWWRRPRVSVRRSGLRSLLFKAITGDQGRPRANWYARRQCGIISPTPLPPHVPRQEPRCLAPASRSSSPPCLSSRRIECPCRPQQLSRSLI